MKLVRSIAVVAAIAFVLSLFSVTTTAQSASCSKTSSTTWFGEDSIVNRVFSLFKKGPSFACGATTTAAPAGLVAWWPGDGNANDIAGTNHGVLQNGAGIAVGKVGQSFVFDGADDFISIGEPPNLKFTNSDFTVEGWFMTPDVPNNAGTQCGARYPIFGYDNGYSVEVFGDGRLRFRKSTGPSTGAAVGSVNPLTVNTLHHFVAVHTTTEMRLYVDGVLDNTTAITDGSVFYVNGDFPEIGHFTCGFSGVFDFYFKGKIDETSVYNRALSTVEVESIFNSGVAGKLKERATVDSNSLAALFQAEGNVADSRGALFGALQNGATFGSGKVGQAFSFDGVNDFVEIPDAPALNPSQLTVEAWVFPTSDTSGGGPDEQSFILGKESVATNQYEIGRRDNGPCGSGGGIPTGNFVFYIEGLSGLPDDCSAWVNGNANLPLNLWSHVAMTFDGANVRAYVNGVLTRTIAVTGAIQTTPGTIQLGGRSRASTAFLQGRIDEPAIYNRALSSAEIRANYDAGNALSTVVGEVRVTFPTVSTAGITQQIPLDPSPLPALPQGSAATGLMYDITTSATFSGSPQVCFNLPSFTTAPAFADLHIFHLENGVWTNRTGASDFASRILCSSGLTSLSPFAIVSGIAAPCVPNQKTWDGGGSTNNWSEAANWTCDTVPTATDLVIFDGTSVKNATIDTPVTIGNLRIDAAYTGTITQAAAATFSAGGLTGTFNQSGGTFNCANAVTFNGVQFTFSGGRFNCSAATSATAIGTSFTLNGGIFDMPASTFSLGSTAGTVELRVKNGATVNHSGGTVVIRQAVIVIQANGGFQDFNNVTAELSSSDVAGTIRVNGTLNLAGGYLASDSGTGVVEAFGPVTSSAASYTSTASGFPATLKFSQNGSTPSPRVVELPSSLGFVNTINLNAPDTTLALIGASSVTIPHIFISAGNFNAGSASPTFQDGGRNGNFSLTGGTFDGGTARNRFVATLFNISGGTFRATTNTSELRFATFVQSGGAFDANGGTFEVFNPSLNVPTSITLNNLIVDGDGLDIAPGDTVNVNGDFLFVNGNLSNALSSTVAVKGNVTIGPLTDAGSASIVLNGTANQTVTNNGGVNPGFVWTVDKPSGTVTVATPLNIGGTQLSVSSGVLMLGAGANLTVGAVTIGANGVLKSESSTTITLGGNLVNNGVVDLQGGGAGCPENDTILIRSTAGQRSWTGGGRYRLVDVDVQNMGGTGTKTVFSGTNSGGNNSTWVFNTNCPAALSVTPSTTSVETGTTRQFTAGGGFGPYSFALATNNSGGSITTGGLYTAGSTINVDDTVRITDVFGQTAEAIASVTGPQPTQIAFTTQPLDAYLGNPVPTISVELRNASGNIIPTATNPVTIALGNNPSGATLSGTVTQNAVGGVATFSGLQISTAGSGYTLVATTGAVPPATSAAFSIATQFQVTNTRDTGVGSLRQAITNANASGIGQTISFAIPGSGPFVINIASSLPATTVTNLTVDGRTQPGFAGTPVVEIRKSGNAGNWLIRGATIRALAINGFLVTGTTVDPILLDGNYFGTDVTGTQRIGNQPAIFVRSNAVITNNIVVTGNNAGSASILINGDNNRIEQNRIGIGANGAALGNGGAGIAFAANAGRFNRITRNRIANSFRLGISLGNQTVVANDPLDADTGPNDRQNYPTIVSAASGAGTTFIAGTLNSTPSQTYELEFFSSPSCNASGFGEGETFIGAATVSTDATGIASFNQNFAVATATGRVITATATDASGNTSEFSQCRTVGAANFEVSGTITDLSGNPVGGVRVKNLSTVSTTMTDSAGRYKFSNLPAGTNTTLTAIRSNTQFAPSTINISGLSSNVTNANFTANTGASISGRVMLSYNGVDLPYGGTTVTLSGTASATTTVDINGNYRFPSLINGAYTVTVDSNPLYTFTPSSRNVTVAGASQTADFNGISTAAEGRILGKNVSGVFTANPDGSALSGIAIPATMISATMSRDGRRLAYAIGSNLTVADFDGTSPFVFRPGSANDLITQVIWSPDRSKLAYIANQNEIRTLNLSAPTVSTTIFTSGQNISFIDWSPDGSRIAFSNATTIRLVNAVSVNQTASGNFPASTSIPRYSPDGTKIAYLQNGNIFIANADGTNPALALDRSSPIVGFAWSPDGGQFAAVEQGASFTMIRTTTAGVQTGFITSSSFLSRFVSWTSMPQSATSTGSNVATEIGGVSVTFAGVGTAGTTTVTQILPSSAGSLPGGFALGGLAYDISTSAAITPPITVCLTVPSTTPLASFNLMTIMHNEGGVLVDRTSSRDFATKKICATTTSLSPFALAEQIDPGLASIGGIAVDENDEPLVGVSMNLTGTETRQVQTDSDGRFMFANLTPGGNYNVSPKFGGRLFAPYNQDFVNVTGEETVAFESTAPTFSISGSVTDGNGAPIAGRTLAINGDAELETVTDSSGNYVFAGLSADGSYLVTPVSDGSSLLAPTFTPNALTVSPLTGNASGIDFQAIVPTAAAVTLGGRAMTANGAGIRNAVVTLTDSSGTTRSVRTGTFGVYSFNGLTAGENYVVTVTAQRFTFANPTRVVNLADSVTDADFVAWDQ